MDNPAIFLYTFRESILQQDLKISGVLFAGNGKKGRLFIKKLASKRPLFVCAIGTTETAKIPNISAAGKNPSMTDYTPPADAEVLLLGRCRCIGQIPVTPEGIPTPAIISRSVLKLAGIPTLIVNAGLKVRPMVPFVDLGGSHGRDIRSGRACENAQEIFQNARILGEHLSKLEDYLVIGESIPGGTTTALAVLLALGIDATKKVSSSMPANPHGLKAKVVKAAFRASGIEEGSLANDTIGAVSNVGDPVLAAVSGLAVGAANSIPVILAGGTQMGAALALINSIEPKTMGNIAIGTTRWIVNDKTSDLIGIVKQIADVPILAADLNFNSSKFRGLRAYEEGVVKEGVGAGGATISAIMKTGGRITKESILKNIEQNYEHLVMEQQA